MKPAAGLKKAAVISAIVGSFSFYMYFKYHPVLGEEEGMRLVERLDGVEALIVTSDGKVLRSSGFRHYEG